MLVATDVNNTCVDAIAKMSAAVIGTVQQHCQIVNALPSSIRISAARPELKASKNHTEEDKSRYMGLAIDSAHAWSTLPMPTIAAINGPCFGWGLEAALACDMRFATHDAKLCFPETRLGIFPGAGGVPRLAKLINPSTAMELIVSARVFTGEEASRLGVVARAVPGGRPKSPV